jgi:hypothetical protein
VVAALRSLADPAAFATRYGLDPSQPVLLYAMGDGNHSFATAKAAWDRIRQLAGPNHPARYALVELENLHDPALQFEPIHRVLFDLKKDLPTSLQAYFDTDLNITPLTSVEEMTRLVEQAQGPQQVFGLVGADRQASLVTIDHPRSNLAVGSLQAFLDEFLEQGGAGRIDYVHGQQTVCRLGAEPGNAGFYLPAMRKSDLFKTVILDGALPRKTFSMGAAREKRFYMEARKIIF